jgi:hypothetical protein
MFLMVNTPLCRCGFVCVALTLPLLIAVSGPASVFSTANGWVPSEDPAQLLLGDTSVADQTWQEHLQH